MFMLRKYVPEGNKVRWKAVAVHHRKYTEEGEQISKGACQCYNSVYCEIVYALLWMCRSLCRAKGKSCGLDWKPQRKQRGYCFPFLWPENLTVAHLKAVLLLPLGISYILVERTRHKIAQWFRYQKLGVRVPAVPSSQGQELIIHRVPSSSGVL